ncbi:hypothetical protein B5V88_16010 [Heyndrickxia sporothermodurans]|uniref:Uncharacterized protein n=1 Tax=Heyndrickxia sporothermodurans TaxID=46224 RepID=A0AB37HKY5_9BACI|nr:hypothetical protein [Heyndrickxia sporothermodurans]MBL5768698.1 hypothetical protein [Heyndrickxia sporothermodurans]MBL5772416.1 hypothetical protein [Heyndrickxia sporothermodurans]MBL5775947.1 hypothetical protein [Heyndrickxia sporothermodurans]MBL5779471.1 hypothetical protein [Heyndrickxia sporothermodurans]MBL5783042.1 hypothetical protein [Heyndrickxia sporothermodurans]
MDKTNIVKQIEELSKKINAFEKVLQKKNTASIHVQIDIQDLHLKELNLEELAFHLDKLDIQDLSGMLNLGNTFSPTVHAKMKTKKSTSKQQKEKDIEIKINGKLTPYSIKNGKEDDSE